MPGEPDQLYIEARRALLDALEALKPHLDSLIVVGAQAIYLHAGEADVAVAPYTKDGDVAVDPRNLGSDPALDAAMLAAGFTPGVQPGIWNRTGTLAQVDLLVPDSLGGPGRHRGARIAGHGSRAVRRVAGMEAALVDNAVTRIGALESSDHRTVEVRVAGPGALLVTKLHKLGRSPCAAESAERQGRPRCLPDSRGRAHRRPGRAARSPERRSRVVGCHGNRRRAAPHHVCIAGRHRIADGRAGGWTIGRSGDDRSGDGCADRGSPPGGPALVMSV